jgi:hypothetical protein
VIIELASDGKRKKWRETIWRRRAKAFYLIISRASIIPLNLYPFTLRSLLGFLNG